MKLAYTAEKLEGKYIYCYSLLSFGVSVWDCVQHIRGVNEGMPVLYDSIQQAKEDNYFDPEWDEVIPASEYYDRLKSQKPNLVQP